MSKTREVDHTGHLVGSGFTNLWLIAVTGYPSATVKGGAAVPQHPEFNVLTATCPSRTSLARIANKWTAMVVSALSGGRLRFSVLRATVEGISGKVLTDTLRDLERDGLVSRHVYAEMPPRVEYELTELGHTLHAPLRALNRWAEEHIDQVLVAREAYDTHH